MSSIIIEIIPINLSTNDMVEVQCKTDIRYNGNFLVVGNGFKRPVLRLKDLFTNCGNIHSVHSTPCGDLFLAKNTNSEGDYSIQPRAPKIFTKRLYF